MKRNARWLVLVVPLIVVVASAGVLAWTRQPHPATTDERCKALAISVASPAFDVLPAGKTTTSQPPMAPVAPPGWDVVRSTPRDREITWTFINNFLDTPDGEELVGVERPDVALDLTQTVRDPRGSERVHRTRQVVLPGNAWIEDGESQQRVACQLESGLLPADMFASTPLSDWGVEDRPRGSRYPDPYLFVPVARKIGERVQAGDTVTVYEQLVDPGLEHLRSEFAVDAKGQLRFHEVHDTRTGELVQHRHADPAPDHPPITDPTGQPIIAKE